MDIEFIVGGIIAVAMFIYLVYALFKAEDI
ncbi:K(+)-transporting ATPase subunit F [Aceticella autotrophica]|uniref:K(+)-transporting ATPase subunit F n=1 Tax=Aceticella autotrophica TaxID=2755338 RepID=A0A975AW74_9THEO|nr:K(+)-transporting ATPase subunit F [Thermoanaerobacteraceae bacterium]QSZ27523.1 K(+)-transporting ATPase subunit F [Aceticella autotrophica]